MHRARLAPAGLQLALELKDGARLTVEFGGEARPGFPAAAVTLASGASVSPVPLDRELWIFEFPSALYQDVLAYLAIPSDIP